MSNAISDVWMKEFEVDAALKSFIKEKRCRANFLYINLDETDVFVGHSFLRALLLKICQKITLLENHIQDKCKLGDLFGDVVELLNRVFEIDVLGSHSKILTKKFILEIDSYKQNLLTKADTSQVARLFTKTSFFIKDAMTDLSPVYIDVLYKNYSEKCCQVKNKIAKKNEKDQNLIHTISEEKSKEVENNSSNQQSKTSDEQPNLPKENVIAKNILFKPSETHTVNKVIGIPSTADLGKPPPTKFKQLEFVKKPANYLTDYKNINRKKKFGSTVVPKRNTRVGHHSSLLVNKSSDQMVSQAPSVGGVKKNGLNDAFENIQVLRNGDCCSQFSAPASRIIYGINNSSKALKLQLPTSQVRKRQPFTKLSDTMLIHGVKKFGKNKWKTILEFYNFPAHRTNVHLKDRWRTLIDRGEVVLEADSLSIISEELQRVYNKVDAKVKSSDDQENSEYSGNKRDESESKDKSQKANTIDDFLSDESIADTIVRSVCPTQSTAPQSTARSTTQSTARSTTQSTARSTTRSTARSTTQSEARSETRSKTKERSLPSQSEEFESEENEVSQTSTMPDSELPIGELNEGASSQPQDNTENDNQSDRSNNDLGSSTDDNNQSSKGSALRKSEIQKMKNKNENLHSIYNKKNLSGRGDYSNSNIGNSSTDGSRQQSKGKRKKEILKSTRNTQSSLKNFEIVASSDEISSGDESLFKSVKSSHHPSKTQDHPEKEVKNSDNRLTNSVMKNRRKRRKFNLFDTEGEQLTWTGTQTQESTPQREYRKILQPPKQPVPKKQTVKGQTFKRKEWKNWEVENLRRGIQMYGAGKWSQILENYKFDNRTALNLKDKYRNLKDKEEM